MPDGMCYVMLGRSERLQDIYIVCTGEMDMSAIRCDYAALEESQRLEKIFEKTEQANKDKKANHWKVSYLNVQSLAAHHHDVCNDNVINDSDIMGLGETWLDKNGVINFDGFVGHFASFGRGKGQASFTKLDLISEPEIVATEKFSAIRLQTEHFCVIFVYLSQNYNKNSVFTLLNEWIEYPIPTAILGDVNENLENSKFEKFMESKGFQQMIQKPTFKEGSIIDHLYVNDAMITKGVFSEQNCCYYSDHDIISLYIEK